MGEVSKLLDKWEGQQAWEDKVQFIQEEWYTLLTSKTLYDLCSEKY